MKSKPHYSFMGLIGTAASFGLALGSLQTARAANLTWDADTVFDGTFGGTGTWDTSTPNWSNASADQAWTTNTTTGDTAVFAGAAGTVTLGTNINALGLQFTTAGYTVALGTNTLTLGAGGINASTLTSGTTTISNGSGGKLFVANGVQTWSVGNGATLALGTIGAGADPADTYAPNGAIVFIKKTGTGTINTTDVNGWGWRGVGTGLLGPGMVIDNGNNTYDWASSGATGGAIVAASYVAAGTGDMNNVRVTGNTTLSLNASWASLVVSGATFTANGSNLYIDTGIILQNGATINGSAPIRANADGLYIYVPDTGSISSSLQNNGTNAKKLYMSGSGTLTLSGNNSYTGGTTVNGGKIALGSANAIGTTGTLSFGGGTLQHSASNTTDYSARFSTAASQAYSVDTNGQNVTWATALTSSGGSLAKSGTGTLTLSNANTYAGGTTVTAGTLDVTGSLADAGAVNVNGGTYKVSNDDTVGAVTLTSGTISNASGKVLTGSSYAVESGTVTGILGGSGALTKSTSGTVTLSGANTYGGNTAVSVGKLLVNNITGSGTGTGSVSVTGGILGGNGTISGATTISAGAIHTAGDSVTAANVSGAGTIDQVDFGTGITYNQDSIFEWNLTANEETSIGTRGVNYDAVNTADLATTGTEAIFRVVLNGGQNFDESFWDSDRTWSDIFTNLAGSTSLNIENIFAGTVQYWNSTGEIANANTTGRSFSINGTSLNWSAVPEPSSALAGVLICASMLRRRRH